MKNCLKTVAALVLLTLGVAAQANQWTCIGPPPIGGNPVCLCDAYGWNCHWVTTGKGR